MAAGGGGGRAVSIAGRSSAARADGARAIGARVDAQACGGATARDERRRLRTIQTYLPRSRDRHRRATGRSLIERAGCTRPATAAGHPAWVRRAGSRVGAEADARAELGR